MMPDRPLLFLFVCVFIFSSSCYVGSENPKYREYTAEETKVILRDAMIEAAITGKHYTTYTQTDAIALILAPEIMISTVPIKPNFYFKKVEVIKCAEKLRILSFLVANSNNLEVLGFLVSDCRLEPSGRDLIHW